MNLHFQDNIPSNFSPHSRVWIYQSNRTFTIEETIRIEDLLNDFSNSWLSHGNKVTGFGTLLFGQFILLMADERDTGVSGCSTDNSVRLMKSIELDHHINLFDRTTLAFIISERIQLIPLAKLNEAIADGYVHAHTLYFNNNIQTKEELLTSWIIPVEKSWLSKRIKSEIQH